MSCAISVALCTCNGAAYLPAQLESIASQSMMPDELVISDDASIDETRSIAEAFSVRAGFTVRLLFNGTRLGPALNFVRAINACSGDIIVLSDQDDVWRRQKVKSLVSVLMHNPDAAYAFSDAEMVDSTGRALGQRLWEIVGFRDRLLDFDAGQQVEVLLKHNVIPGSSMALRAAFWRRITPLPDGWMHDYWIALLGSVLERGIAVEDALFEYRRHADQVCGWRKKTLRQVCTTSLKTDAADFRKKLEVFRCVVSKAKAIIGPQEKTRQRVMLLEDKEAHLTRRARARAENMFFRVFSVLTEMSTGRYQRYSNAWYSILRDL